MLTGVFLGTGILASLFFLGKSKQLTVFGLDQRVKQLVSIFQTETSETAGEPALAPTARVSLTPAQEASPTPSISPTTEETAGPSPVQTDALRESITYNVPFTAQAPLGNWGDPLLQDGCEEASSLMAVRWAKAEPIPSPEAARDMIVAAGQWQKQNYPTGIDTSAEDTADRIIQNYFEWPHVRVEEITSVDPILSALQTGSLVITPMNGQALGNPNYAGEGPERHMLVVIGYDAQTQEIITNDPGTRQGSGYRYSEDIFWNAIRDYPTGKKVPITETNKVMIVVSKP